MSSNVVAAVILVLGTLVAAVIQSCWPSMSPAVRGLTLGAVGMFVIIGVIWLMVAFLRGVASK